MAEFFCLKILQTEINLVKFVPICCLGRFTSKLVTGRRNLFLAVVTLTASSFCGPSIGSLPHFLFLDAQLLSIFKPVRAHRNLFISSFPYLVISRQRILTDFHEILISQDPPG